MSQVSVKGGPELIAFLEAFPKRLQKGALRAGATAAAKPIRDEARNLARKQSGKMAKSIKTGSPRVDKDGNVKVSIRLKGEHAFLGPFHEWGVGAHFIAAGDSGKSARLLTRASRRDGMESDGEALKIGNNFVSGAVLHPGMAAHPFMRPALDLRYNEAITAFGERIQTYMKGKTGFSAPLLEVEVDE